MKKYLLYLLSLFLISGCVHGKRDKPEKGPAVKEVHLRNVKQLTFDGDNGEAYFNRDDTKLIFQSSREEQKCDKIWTMKIDGSDKMMVSPEHGAHTCSFFLPDGRMIFASTSHLDEECPPRPEPPAGHRYVWPLFSYDIFIVNPDGSGLRKITDNPKYDAEPVVSSDGEKIVFGSQREGDFDIYSMKTDGSDVRRLTDTIGYDGGPWFSPDGTKIVWRAWYPRTDEEKAQWKDAMEKDYILAVPLDIWVMDTDGTNKKRLISNGATNWAPSWHPDGKRIVFSSNMDDWRDDIKRFGHNFELYIMNSDGTGIERLTYNDVFDSFPMFSHDGKKIVFASNRNPDKPRETDIYIADWME